MGIIYVATNLKNGKQYVGQTTYNLAKRSREHYNDASRGRDSKFCRAIRKYGFDSFTFEAIENVDNNMLNERERYWVNELDTYHTGYNSTFGGDGNQTVDSDMIIDMWVRGASISDITSSLGYCSLTVGNTLRLNDWYVSEESKHRGKRNQMHSVAQYDLDGKFIRLFDSIASAANKYGVDRSLISACCRRKRLSGAGFQWRYSDDEPPDQYSYEQKCSKPVLQFDVSGELIAEYTSMTRAQNVTGICREAISACCCGSKDNAGGFIWRLKNEKEA